MVLACKEKPIVSQIFSFKKENPHFSANWIVATGSAQVLAAPTDLGDHNRARSAPPAVPVKPAVTPPGGYIPLVEDHWGTY